MDSSANWSVGGVSGCYLYIDISKDGWKKPGHTSGKLVMIRVFPDVHDEDQSSKDKVVAMAGCSFEA